MTYDSTEDTIKHAHVVHQLAEIFTTALLRRTAWHDLSKLFSPEKILFDEYSPRLNETEYGTPEYQEALDSLKPAVEHHYAENPHHPEHHENGLMDMTLVDLLEMFCDWKAASGRTRNGDFLNSIAINEERFDLDPQITALFRNTAKALGWDK